MPEVILQLAPTHFIHSWHLQENKPCHMKTGPKGTCVLVKKRWIRRLFLSSTLSKLVLQLRMEIPFWSCCQEFSILRYSGQKKKLSTSGQGQNFFACFRVESFFFLSTVQLQFVSQIENQILIETATYSLIKSCVYATYPMSHRYLTYCTVHTQIQHLMDPTLRPVLAQCGSDVASKRGQIMTCQRGNWGQIISHINKYFLWCYLFDVIAHVISRNWQRLCLQLMDLQ